MIGRADASEAIARFMDRVPDGPAGLVIEGEPGIGKTTIMSEAVRAAQKRGYRVLQARPAEAESDLSSRPSATSWAAFSRRWVVLPAPQRQALEVALLLRDHEPPALDIEDPELVAVARCRKFIERERDTSRRDPGLEWVASTAREHAL
jgi:hypothetical protein